MISSKFEPGIFENPCAAQSPGYALHSRALRPIERCHVPILPFIVAFTRLRRPVTRGGKGCRDLTAFFDGVRQRTQDWRAVDWKHSFYHDWDKQQLGSLYGGPGRRVLERLAE